MSDESADKLKFECLDKATKCEAAQECFEIDTAPWRWLRDTAKCYRTAADLLGPNNNTSLTVVRKG